MNTYEVGIRTVEWGEPDGETVEFYTTDVDEETFRANLEEREGADRINYISRIDWEGKKPL
jgi:hypothetical protein